MTASNRLDTRAPAWTPRPPAVTPGGKRGATVSYAISPSTTLFFDLRKDRRPAALDSDGDWPAAKVRSGRGYMLGLTRRW
jgi:hypothetical protein